MKTRRPRRGGFTLVEMLVVITIIGILAAILVPTVGNAIKSAKLAAMATELNNLEQAFEAYKLDHKDYPPDFSNREAVFIHVTRAFPRYPRAKVTQWLDSGPGATLDPAEAIVFWLSRTKNNPRDPFTGAGENKVYFEFKEELLTNIDNDDWPEYASPHAQGRPYVYFDGRIQNDLQFNSSSNACVATTNPAVCAYAWTVYPPPATRLPCVGQNIDVPLVTDVGFGVVRPYRSNNFIPADDNFTQPRSVDENPTEWLAARKFQIIAAGVDGFFGADHFDTNGGVPVYKTFPQPNYYQPAFSPAGADMRDDRDNLANFSEGQTVGDAIP